MGYELRRMIRDGAPPDWTGPMVHVASEIADSVWADPSQDGGAVEAPVSTVPIKGYWTPAGVWRDGLVERTGMSARAVSRALQDLAEAGYEMRVAIGRTEAGRPVFAAKGHALTFTVPRLPPRPVPQRAPRTATFDAVSDPVSSPSTACYDPAEDAAGADSPPRTATFDGGAAGPKVAKDAAKHAKDGDLRAPKVAKDGNPISLREDPSSLQSCSDPVADGSVERDGASSREDRDQEFFQPSFLVGVSGGQRAPPGSGHWHDPQQTAREQAEEAKRHRKRRGGRTEAAS